MPDLRFFVIPGVLLAATVAYVGANPAGSAIEPTATAEPTSTIERPVETATATPAAEPSPAATRVPLSEQLPGLSGRVTYQSARGLVTVEFPSGATVEPPAIEPDFGGSDDGVWQERLDCGDDGGCDIALVTRDGRVTQIAGRYAVWSASWQPGAHAYAAAVSPPGALFAEQIIVIDDAASSDVRVAYEGRVEAFAWYGDDSLLVAVQGESGATHLERVDRNGIRALGIVDAPIAWLYASPDGETFAFTQSKRDGWHLSAVNVHTETVRDYGLMGSDGAGAVPVTLSQEVKSPMAVAWSPDGSRIAFGGGWEPPYGMTIVDLRTGDVARTEFPKGYPGEMRWNSAGTQVAVSTYDPERTHHETWVVEAETGAGVHLMDGCIIVWSPDDRFLAVHGEDVIGISIVDVATGARMRLTEDAADAPLRWD
jgi:hypothetical protein